MPSASKGVANEVIKTYPGLYMDFFPETCQNLLVTELAFFSKLSIGQALASREITVHFYFTKNLEVYAFFKVSK